MPIHQQVLRTTSPLTIVVMILLLFGMLTASPAAAQEGSVSPVTVDLISVSCEGLIEYTYTADQQVAVRFQFHQERYDYGDIALFGAVIGQHEPGTEQYSTASATVGSPFSPDHQPKVSAIYDGSDGTGPSQELDSIPFPADCTDGTETPPSGPSSKELVAQIVAILIAILTSLLGGR